MATEEVPIKQGLKHFSHFAPPQIALATEEVPIKQGLKHKCLSPAENGGFSYRRSSNKTRIETNNLPFCG